MSPFYSRCFKHFSYNQGCANSLASFYQHDGLDHQVKWDVGDRAFHGIDFCEGVRVPFELHFEVALIVFFPGSFLGPISPWTSSFLAATKQFYEWYFSSVCLSVCLSVTPFWLCSHHCIITKCSGVITNDKSDVHAKGQDQRSKVKVTEATTQLNSFWTVTPVWIQMWWWNDAYSLMLLRRGALLFFKVIRQISRSHGSIIKFDPDWAFPDCNSSLDSPMATKWCTKLEVA